MPPAAEAALRAHVRALGGLCGADSLSRSAGVSRRSAAAIKRDELAAMERERRAGCDVVRVTAPGVVRGFDAMHLGDVYALIAADAAVAYRTSVAPVPMYDGAHVAAVLEADFRRHGAPLVLRLDRAACHTTDDVLSVLRAYRVLLLQGPPRHPQYYGQLERQNREHRAWLRSAAAAPAASAAVLERMRRALNGLWRRRTLGWLTAEEVWMARPPVREDRDALREDVEERTARLRRRDVSEAVAARLATEQALAARGYLKVIPGRRVLCA